MKTDSPFLHYLPFFAIYLLMVFAFHDDMMVGDEARYMMFAKNLLMGQYSPVSELNIWNGPGYPIFLFPFVFLKLPIISITLANAFFHYLSVVLVFKTVKLLSGDRLARIVAIVWGLYFIAWQSLQYIMAECISIFLISLLAYLVVRHRGQKGLGGIIGAGLVLGYLALTKIIFAYVIVVCLIIYIVKGIYQKFRFGSEAKILLISLIPLIPYLIYTYNLTGRSFYLGNSGGMSLYFMSTPYEGEFGDWNNETFTGYCDGGVQPCNSEFFLKNHKEDFDYIYSAKGVERDDRFKELAIANIKEHPIKFLRNCLANQGRMWFRYPFSFRFQKDLYLGIAFPNAILFTFFIYTLMFWLIRIKHIRRDLNFIGLILVVYLGGSTMLSAYPRQLYIMVPMMLVLISFALKKSLKINLDASG